MMLKVVCICVCARVHRGMLIMLDFLNTQIYHILQLTPCQPPKPGKKNIINLIHQVRENFFKNKKQIDILLKED